MGLKNPHIKIEPVILKYARYYSGFTLEDAAQKLGFKVDDLKKAEEENTELSLSKVRKLANLYKRPLAFFLLKKTPDGQVLPKDFRRIYSSEEESFSPKLMLAIRKARYVQSILQEMEHIDWNYQFKKVSLKDDIDKIAAEFRESLGVSIEQQSKWSNPSTALRNWKEAVERMGVFVLQDSLSGEEVDAFSLADQEPYILVLNSSTHENRRIFSLFHEIGHILLRRSGVCTTENLAKNSSEYIQVEKFCNQFAASILVPYKVFFEHSIVQKFKNIPVEEWEKIDVETLSKFFRVSRELIYRRFVSVKMLSQANYEKERRLLLEEYKKMTKKKNAPIPQHIKVISQNGRSYTRFVLDKLHSNQITLVDAATYLNTNARHITQIQNGI